MKRIIVVSLLSAFSLLFVVSCFDAKDFDMDKLSTSDVKPTLSVPLFKDSLWLDPSSTLGENIKYVGDTAVFYFAIDKIELPGMGELITIPAVDVSLPSDEFVLPIKVEGDLLVGLYPPQERINVVFPLANGEKIDQITVDNMKLTVVNEGNMASTFTVVIPKFTKAGEATAGATYTCGFAEPGSEVLSLSGTLALTNNAFDVYVGIQGPSSLEAGTYTYGGHLSFNAPSTALKSAVGYFGQSTFSAQEKVMVDAFDKLTGECALESAYLNISATNYTGIPVWLNLSEVTAGGITVTEVGSLTVEAASSATSNSRVTNGRIGGPALAPIINAIISGGNRGTVQAGFAFDSKSNPDGNTGVKNFFTSSDKTFEASGEVIVPLHLKADNLTLHHTLDLNVDYTFDDLSANVFYVNNMPVEVSLQGVLLDSYNHPIADLFETPVTMEASADIVEGRVVQPKTGSSPGVFTNEAMKGMKDASKIEVALTVKTAGDTPVLITKDNYVKIQIGAQAKVSLGDIDE